MGLICGILGIVIAGIGVYTVRNIMMMYTIYKECAREIEDEQREGIYY